MARIPMLLVFPCADFKITFIHIPTVGNNNRTALHMASIDGHIEVVKLLVDHGADVNAIGMSLGQFQSHLHSHLNWRQQQPNCPAYGF
jgi:hypothetical protein